MADRDLLLQQLSVVSSSPGVYLMKDRGGRVIYVGKALALRDRLRSYFSSGKLPAKVVSMLRELESFEYIVTDNELEALILENNLIKQYRPRYNVMLRDDKSYPYIKITVKEPWPRLVKTRVRQQDGSLYFGPFTGQAAAARTIDLLQKLFPIRDCDLEIRSDKPVKPCLKYHLGRCLGPCAGVADRDEYAQAVRQAALFLDGKQAAVIKELRAAMLQAAHRLEFERAAKLRDQLEVIAGLVQKQKAVLPRAENLDVCGFYREGDTVAVQVFFVREGRLLGRDTRFMTLLGGEELPEVVQEFLLRYYDAASQVPENIIVPALPRENSLIQGWFAKRGHRPTIRLATRGKLRELVAMAERNAQEALVQERVRTLGDEARASEALTELKDVLELRHIPQRIECYDVSNLQKSFTVGSQVTFDDGRPNRKLYKKYRISLESGPNDFEALRQMIARRLAHAKAGEPGWSLPDLLMVDGGPGQLSYALSALEEAGLSDIPVVALAKENEEIYLPGRRKPLVLPAGSAALQLLQRIRDEAHRFALGYHRKVRSAASTRSLLEEIPGIGPKRRQRLIHHFGSLRRIREADPKEIVKVTGLSLAQATRLKELL
jgi:excinuclease ABC subunit C